MKHAYGITGLVAVAAIAGGLSLAAERTGAEPADEAGRTVVVELFTSQGCYSCPPAEAFLGELAKRSDVIALEFHVDYWDDLVYGAAGKWKDPFSSPQSTQRQRRYARSFGTGRIYTPQMVVDGYLQGVGSNRKEIHSAIRNAKTQVDSPVALEATRDPSGSVILDIDASNGSEASLWLVSFIPSSTTSVLAGENKGKSLTSHNIVKDMVRIDGWNGKSGRVTIPKEALVNTQSCAILVQSQDLGPIVSATYCPAAPS